MDSVFFLHADHHGFFYTHDGAYRHSDNGYSITGRVDDMITMGESRFDSDELESTMVRNSFLYIVNIEQGNSWILQIFLVKWLSFIQKLVLNKSCKNGHPLN